MYRYHEEPEFPNWWDVLDENDSAPEGVPLGMSNELEESRFGSPLERRPDDLVDSLSASEGKEVFREKARRFNEVKESGAVAYAVSASRGYDREVVENVWNFAEIIPGNDPDLWRKDESGHWIRRIDYGRRDSEFGWEIFDPGVGRHSQGVYVMRPMQWKQFLDQFEIFS